MQLFQLFHITNSNHTIMFSNHAHSIGTTLIELREEEEKRHGQNGKMILSYNFHIWCFLTEIFCTLFSFHTYSDIKSLKVKKSESKN